MKPSIPDFRYQKIRVADGVALNVATAGTGSPIVLLHGFPQTHLMWRHVAADLAADHTVICPDLRGYGDSDKPPRGYDGWTLAGDTDGLIRALGHSDATIVGHADGGLVGWATATLHPRSVRSMAVISSPHPQALKNANMRESTQRKAFLGGLLRAQIPRTAERDLTRSGETTNPLPSSA